MKKTLFLLYSLCTLSSTPALAVTLTFADVGGYDAYLDYSTENANEKVEMGWFVDHFPEFADDLAYVKWEATNYWQPTADVGSTVIYMDFETGAVPAMEDPFAFLVKSANGGSFTFDIPDDGIAAVTASSVLFENLPNTQYGVIDLSWFTKKRGTFAIEAISHTSAAAVPEPSSLILFGSGLAGLMFVVRRRKNK